MNRKQTRKRRYLTRSQRIELLYRQRDRAYIPRGDRTWFWTTFRALRASGWDYGKAWDFTVWALEESYGR